MDADIISPKGDLQNDILYLFLVPLVRWMPGPGLGLHPRMWFPIENRITISTFLLSVFELVNVFHYAKMLIKRFL